MFGAVDLKSPIYLTYLLMCALFLLLSTSESGRLSCVRTFHPVTSDFFFLPIYCCEKTSDKSYLHREALTLAHSLSV